MVCFAYLREKGIISPRSSYGIFIGNIRVGT